MADIDLSTQFDKISDKAKIASDKLKAANNKTRERLESDVTDARDRASAAADRLNDKAVDARTRPRRSGTRCAQHGRRMLQT